MAIITVAPAKPPSAAVGVNASATTQARTRGSWSMCRMMTIREMRTYITAMAGTTLPATAPMRFTPPMRTAPASRKTATAVNHVGMERLACMASPMELPCTIAPVPIQATMPNSAKHEPSHIHLGPSPFLMKYMAPPTQFPAGVFSRKCTERSTSLNLVAIPTRAVTHIQNSAPGPPM